MPGFHGVVFVSYVLLALLHTYPLARHLATHLPGLGLGDNVSFVWNLWWMREAIASPAHTFFASPMLFAPLGVPLVLHTHTALLAAVGATLLAAVPLVAAQNVALILTLVLNGFAAYLLALTVTGSRSAAAIAGALFLLSPAITLRLMGHYNLVVAWPLVLSCVALLRWWQVRTRGSAILLGLAAASLAYTDYYYVVYFLLFAVAYIALEIFVITGHADTRRTQWPSRLAALGALVSFGVAISVAMSPIDQLELGSLQLSLRTPTNALTAAWFLLVVAAFCRWKSRLQVRHRGDTTATAVGRSLVLPVAVATVLMLPIVMPAWELIRAGDYATQSSSLKSSPKGVELVTLLLGPPYNGLVGAGVREAYASAGADVMESSAWLGVVVPCLLIVGVRRRRGDVGVRHWVALLVGFSIWALGPYLMVLGHNSGLLLPQSLAHFVPVLNNARIPARAMVMVDLCAAIIAAIVMARASLPRRHLVLGLILLAGIVERLGPPLPLVRLSDAGVYRHIAEDRGTGAVLPLPLGVRDGFGELGLLEHDALYAQTIHRHPLVGGFVARLPSRMRAWYETTEPYATLLALSRGQTTGRSPDCEAISAGLRQAAVAYVVLYRADASMALQSFVNARMPLEPIAHDDTRTLFRVAADTLTCSE
jgi:hypothetical protein